MKRAEIQFTQKGEPLRCDAVINQRVDFGTVLNYVWQEEILFSGPDGREHILPAGTAYWTFPDLWYSYRARKDYWHQMWIVFKGPSADAFEQEGLIPRHYFFQKVKRRNRFESQLRDLYSHCLSKDTWHLRRSANLLESLFLQLHEEQHEDDISEPGNRIQLVIQNLLDDPLVDVDFQDCAADCHMSYSHFRRCFKELSGMSPQDFLLHARMQEAWRRLSDRKRSVKEVAWEMGYDNLHYFSRLFKKQMGMSPRHYQQNALPVR